MQCERMRLCGAVGGWVALRLSNANGVDDD